MKSYLGSALVLGLLASPALAQRPSVVPPSAQSQTNTVCYDPVAGALIVCTDPGGGAAAGSPQGTPAETAVACTTSGAVVLAAGAATREILIRSPRTNSVTAWLNFAGATVTMAPPDYDLQPDNWIAFDLPSFVPSSQILCKTTAGTATLTVIAK